MDKNEIKKRIQEEEDYIRYPKSNNSLSKFLAKNSDELDSSTIARLLMLTEKEVDKIYEDAVKILRAGMDK